MKYNYALEVGLNISNGIVTITAGENLPVGRTIKAEALNRYVKALLEGSKGVVRDRKTNPRMSVEAGGRALEYLNSNGSEFVIAPKSNPEANLKTFLNAIYNPATNSGCAIPFEILNDLCAGRIVVTGVVQIALKSGPTSTPKVVTPVNDDDDLDSVPVPFVPTADEMLAQPSE